MSERGGRRAPGGAGAPFYAPPKRKTSAEIISEARAAVYGEMSGTGALRPLRTRRPFTPREPQRTLFAERTTRKKDTRPPSAFDLKYLSLSESQEETILTGSQGISLCEDVAGLFNDAQNNVKKKIHHRNQSRTTQDRSGDGWAGLPKLPHLNGRSKPLHRRNGQVNADEKSDDLSQAISITRPLGSHGDDSSSGLGEGCLSKSQSMDWSSKRKSYGGSKSNSCEVSSSFGDIGVKHLAVQLPNTSLGEFEHLTILEIAEALTQKTIDVDRTVSLLDCLLIILEKNNPTGSLRELVLRGLYTHIDSEDEIVLVGIARALLTMRVTKTHLSSACKLVFKIARCDSNDHFFRNTNLLELLIEGCGRCDPLSESECCVYGAGALRFLALDPRLCALAHKVGALHLAALHLKILNNAKLESPRIVSEQANHAMYQVTGALRNLAGGSERDVREFIASGALEELVTALQRHTDRDVLTNVARCLSVLSASPWCCSWLSARSGAARGAVRALAACGARPELCVRLAYTLGNMAAAHPQARDNIFNEEGSVDVLLTILESYTKRNTNEYKDPECNPDLHLVGSDLGGSDGSNEDVLIKTVRVLANLCLSERAGRGLASEYAERVYKALLACLEIAEKTDYMSLPLSEEQTQTWHDRQQELGAASLATLNNFTFYREPPEPPDPMDTCLGMLCSATCRWLSATGPASCEAIRALGNLTRALKCAQQVVLEGALVKLVPFLGHEDPNVRCASAGVLVNVCGAGVDSSLAADIAARALYSAAHVGDSSTAALLTRALWNAHTHRPLSEAQDHQVVTALTMLIDDESVFAACEATRGGDRRASDPAVLKQHVKFDIDNNNLSDESDKEVKPFVKANSVDHDIHLQEQLGNENLCSGDEDADHTGCSGSDLGFEDEEVQEEECTCTSCTRLAAWEELLGVAVPLLEKLRPHRIDANVGTD